MDIKDICNAGGDILDAVADAINRNDYRDLSQNVNRTVNRVVSQVRAEARKGSYGEPTHQYGKTTYTRQGQRDYRSIHKTSSGKYESLYRRNPARPARTSYQKINSAKLPATVTKHPSGRIIGPIQLAWGILATCGFGITALVMTIMVANTAGQDVFVVLSAVFGVLTALSVIDIVRGSKKIGLVNRFYRYVRLIGDKSYIAIADLAFQTGQEKEAILRDLKKMMNKHMFLQGRFDSQQKTFLLTQEAYEQYLQAEQESMEKEKEKKRLAEEESRKRERDAYDAQTKKILEDGNAYIRMVHECNERIQNENMSDKLSKLEAIMRKIFKHVEKEPESADDLHKFMDYYLPTTTKLLNAYLDLDSQEITGANMSATKKEIEDTFDTINVGFEKLLDSLFEDTAWDISSDISVMKTMMEQEGLTGKNDFKL